MKKLIKVMFAVAIVILATTNLSVPAYANSIESKINSEVIDLNGPTTKVRVISFDEMVEEIAYYENKSIDSIRSRFIANKKMELSNTNDSQILSNNNDSQILSTLTATSYITVKVGGFPTLKSTYKPTGLSFYGEGYSPGYDKYVMTKILNIVFDRSNAIGTGSKQFSGTVYTNLEASDRIYYSVDGDFYDNGTTTYNGGVDIPIGDAATVSFGVSYSSNHFSYMFHTGRWYGTW